jgi:Xaa-Pro aminopeptidase
MLTPNDFFPPFSPGEYERRRRVIRESMRERGLDCLVVYGAHHWAGTDSGQVNAVYLANYAAIPHGYVILPLDAEPTLFLSFGGHLTNAREISAVEDVRVGGFDLVPAVAARLEELGLGSGRIGIVGPLPSWWTNTIPVEHHAYLTGRFPGARFETVSDWYEGFRLAKSDEEIERMRRAAALTDQAQEAVIRAARVGVRHSDLRRLVEEVVGQAGGRYPFSHVGSTSMANPDRVYPDFYPTHRTIAAGDVVMTEVAAGYGLYFGKLWATWFMGEPTDEYRRLFELAVSVYDRVVDELRPGMTARDVDRWLDPFREAGCTNGLALVSGWSSYNHAPNVGRIDEPVQVAPDGPDEAPPVFEPGQTLTVNAYPILRGTHVGIWVGTTCVLTDHGLDRLHAYPVTTLRVLPTTG